MENITKVGIGVMVMKDSQALLGKRKSSHGAGGFATPGGHLEYMESFEDCARREVREECGIEIKNIKFLYVSNVKQYAPKHYVHISLIAELASGEVQNMEPEKCEGWDWYDLDNLPDNMFIQSKVGIEAFKTGRNYWDA
ncbi:MAG: NUDIX domain-containing protein [Patescibacteria group bacterium]